MNALTMTIPEGLKLKAVEPADPPGVTGAARAAVEAGQGAGVEKVGVVSVLERAVEAIHRYVFIRTSGDTHIVDEVMQQLWIAARKGPELEPSAAEAWLRGVAKNLIANHWRGVARRPVNLPLPDLTLAAEMARTMSDLHAPMEVLGRVEVRNQLLLALTELESAEQDLLVRFYFAGQSQAVLSAELGVSERAIEGRLYRARQSLKKRLSELDT